MNNMTWLDLYNFLNDQANNTKNIGNFPWQEDVKAFDFDTLTYFNIDFIEMPDGKISFSLDSGKLEHTNDE